MMALAAVGAFVAMEGVSYATHRWVMHGFGIRWHRSHHVPAHRGWEANDAFPALFSTIGFTLFVLSVVGPRLDVLWWTGVGVTVYGVAYLFVHDIYIHHRLPLRLPKLAMLERLRDAHEIHHLYGGEPYGMLFPVVPRELRDRARARAMRSRL